MGSCGHSPSTRYSRDNEIFPDTGYSYSLLTTLSTSLFPSPTYFLKSLTLHISHFLDEL
jgi:hypothetical protein